MQGIELFMAEQTTDALRAMRKKASEQRRVCLPLDKPGWDRHYKAATAELERRGITCTPYPKHRTTAA